MVREWRRLLVEPARLQDAAAGLLLQPEELHYLRRVLRLRSGERFALIDGCGHLWTATLEAWEARSLARAQLEQPLECPCVSTPPAAPQLCLAVAPPRRDPEVMLRMACELGMDGIQWLQSERSLPEALPRASRQAAVLREALEQCERLWLPRCAGPEPFESWLATPPAGLTLLATTRDRGAGPLLQVLADHGLSAAGPTVTVAIGPEGGWSPAEEELARSRGWLRVSLGEAILRSSTAAVAAASLLSAWREAAGG